MKCSLVVIDGTLIDLNNVFLITNVISESGTGEWYPFLLRNLKTLL